VCISYVFCAYDVYFFFCNTVHLLTSSHVIMSKHKTVGISTIHACQATAAATAANKVMEKAKKSMDMSTKHVESIHELSTKAKKEVEDAQKFLAEVEKRYEVIEITDDDDTVI